MKKNTLITILIVAILLAGLGTVWYVMQQSQTQPTNDGQNNSSSESTAPPSSATQNQASDQGQQTTGEQVMIKDRTFTPARLTIKKGTTVTWTNEDTIRHNVVADDAANSGGLPTTAQLFGKGETFSHSFTETGTFTYHCTPHPDMKGTIEVIE